MFNFDILNRENYYAQFFKLKHRKPPHLKDLHLAQTVLKFYTLAPFVTKDSTMSRAQNNKENIERHEEKLWLRHMAQKNAQKES
jgi:hypothetical protein